MIEPHGSLSLVRQCQLMSISRSSYYFTGKGESRLNLSLMRMIDEQFLGDALVWFASDGALAEASGLLCEPQTDTPAHAQDGACTLSTKGRKRQSRILTTRFIRTCFVTLSSTGPTRSGAPT